MTPLSRRLASEYLATLLLLTAVIGSGVMGERLAGGNLGIALLANTFATMGALYVLIEMFGLVSGAHMNPLVSTLLALRGELDRRFLLPYVIAQGAGAVCGAWLAHAMFELPILQWSQRLRTGPAQWLGEIVATAGLMLVVLRVPAARIPAAVAVYIGAAYWFTSSTSFANPAAVLGRMLTDTFAGVAPSSAWGFVVAECAGAALGAAVNAFFESHAAAQPR